MLCDIIAMYDGNTPLNALRVCSDGCSESASKILADFINVAVDFTAFLDAD